VIDRPGTYAIDARVPIGAWQYCALLVHAPYDHQPMVTLVGGSAQAGCAVSDSMLLVFDTAHPPVHLLVHLRSSTAG
jgi:hypothetical protein